MVRYFFPPIFFFIDEDSLLPYLVIFYLFSLGHFGNIFTLFLPYKFRDEDNNIFTKEQNISKIKYFLKVNILNSI